MHTWSEAELCNAAVGVDRGIATPFYASNGLAFQISPTQLQRIDKKERARKR